MKRSLNEIEVMVLKAARGAGLALAQAQDLSQAARQGIAAINDLPQPDVAPRTDLFLTALMRVLYKGGQPPEAEFPKNGILLGNGASATSMCAALDLTLAGQTPVTIRKPEILVFRPMIALAEQNHSIAIRWQRVGGNGGDITLTGASGPRQRQLSTYIGAADIPEPAWDQLASLAAKTYVPDTAQSRSAGAGAGLTDND